MRKIIIARIASIVGSGLAILLFEDTAQVDIQGSTVSAE